MELKLFSDAVAYASLIVIIGPRRTGKTSFMNVALAESGFPYINLDLRGLSYNPSRADIIRKLEVAFNQINRKWLHTLCNALTRVKGVKILGNVISLDWSKTRVVLPDLFDKINAWALKQGTKFLVAFDEIQFIRGDKQILSLFAHIVDTNRRVTLVVTGSEVGLLFDFLGFDDAESPLYGRHYTEIRMRNFDPREAEAYLLAGFQQIAVPAPTDVIRYAIEKLDGIVGWLTLFGAECRDHNVCNKDLVDEVVHKGGKLARAEALKLTALSRRYGVILNFLAKGTANWAQIKAILEAQERRSLPNPTITDILNTLVKTSLITKSNGQYHITDPLLITGIQKESLPEE
ncbi:MAG: ATP-binding protein [archaeon]|nr:ATP-binding protein [archaeon]